MDNKITRTPIVIVEEINAIRSQTAGILNAAFSMAKRSCFEIGKRLEEAKALVPHGEWGTWLEDNFDYSESTAGNLMRIYREYGSEQIDMLTGRSDAEIFEGLSQSQLVELFALPKPQRAEFVEEHREQLESGDMSIRDMRELIRTLREELDALQDVAEDRKYLKEQLEERDRELACAKKAAQNSYYELEQLRALPAAAPQEVTVVVNQPSDEQINAIRAEAEEALAASHRAEVDKLNEKHAKALQKAQKESAGELDKLREQMAEQERTAALKLRQASLASDPHAAKVSYSLEAIRRAIADINAEIKAMDATESGSGQKLRARCESTLLRIVNDAGWQI
jgi:hypothetical protein